MNTSRRVLVYIESFVYLLIVALGAFTLAGITHYWNEMQARTIIAGSAVACLGVWGTMVVERFTKIRCSLLIDIIIAIDLFISIILGETLEFYYIIPYYDRFLHFIGTAELSVLGYAIFKTILRKSKNGAHQIALSLLFGFFFAVALEAMWELYEWACDCLGGTNMQKLLPNDFLENLNGDDLSISDSYREQVLSFYSTREGYSYAVQDTMGDILVDTLGGLFGVLSTHFFMKKWPKYQDRVLYFADENLAFDDAVSQIESKKFEEHKDEEDQEIQEEKRE